jgi:surfeit locus 1 family protein
VIVSRFLRAGLVLPTVFALGALAILCGLGTWQLQRLHWKRDLVALMASRIKGPVLDLAQITALDCFRPASDTDPCEYLNVRLKGRFRHEDERHVFIALDGRGGGPSGPGFWVFTPLELEAAAGISIYVNRGFTPQALKVPAQRRMGQIEGIVEVTGVLRRPEPRGTFSAGNDAARNIWFVRSPSEFQGAGTPRGGMVKDVYVEQTSPSPAAGAPPFVVPMRLELPNRHLEYAMTWFGLAATLIGVYIAFVFARLKASGSSVT